MKKSLYFTLAAATLMVTACEEDYTDWAPAQVSTEGAASTIAGAVSAASASIDAASAGDVITLLSTSAAEGCHINLTHLYLNENTEVPFELVDGNVTIKADDLAAAVRDCYKSLAATTRELAFTGNFAMVNAQGEASPIEVAPVKVNYTTPALPANASDKAYYYVGGYNGWNLADPTPFVAKGDGIFELTISIGDGEWFAFAPQSAVDAQDWNALFRAPSNGCTDASGYLDNDPTTGWSFNCEVGGNYTFILDMVNYTYKYFHHIESAYYYIGALATDKSYPLTNGGGDPLENPVFTAVIPALGDGWHWFKIAPESGFNEDGSWNWDNESLCACATAKDDESMSGKFVIGGDRNSWHLMEDQYPAKFYRLTFNFVSQEYSITPVNYSEYIYYAGDWTSWGDGKRELALTDTEAGIYTGYYFINAVDNSSTWGFKFIDADGNWYGGGNGVLNSDANCDPGAEGFYKIQVNWANMTYELTKIETVSLIGGATGDSSWGTDLDMTWTGECWEYKGHLEAGEFKFRANHDWNGINWGGDKNNLVVDQANANIEAAGDYTLRLYCNCPGKAYYTLE